MSDRSQVFRLQVSYLIGSILREIFTPHKRSLSGLYQRSSQRRRDTARSCLYDRAAVISVIQYVKEHIFAGGFIRQYIYSGVSLAKMCKAPPSYIRRNDCNAIRQMSEYVKDRCGCVMPAIFIDAYAIPDKPGEHKKAVVRI